MAAPLAAAAPYIAGGLASLGSSLMGGNESSKRTEKLMRLISSSGFEPAPTNRVIQNFLPSYLQSEQIGPAMTAGFQNIGALLRNPGALSPTVAEAILPRQAMESERVGREFQGIKAEQAGAAARSNLPVSIKNALASALNVAQERAQRDVRRGALADTDQLRRQDLQMVFPILDAILQFVSSARGQSIQGLGAAGGIDQDREASQLAMIGSILSNLGSLPQGQKSEPRPVS
jgi:hypothetical protein